MDRKIVTLVEVTLKTSQFVWQMTVAPLRSLYLFGVRGLVGYLSRSFRDEEKEVFHFPRLH